MTTQILNKLMELSAYGWHPNLVNKFPHFFENHINGFLETRGELNEENKWALHFIISNGIKKNPKMINYTINDIDSIKNKIVVSGYHAKLYKNEIYYKISNPLSIYEFLKKCFGNEIEEYRTSQHFNGINSIDKRLKSHNSQYTFHSITEEELTTIAENINTYLINEN